MCMEKEAYFTTKWQLFSICGHDSKCLTLFLSFPDLKDEKEETPGICCFILRDSDKISKSKR